MPPWASGGAAATRSRGFAAGAVEVRAPARPVLVRANGQPAVAYYLEDAETGRFKAGAIDVLTLEGTRIREITAFVTPEVFDGFGLPGELA